MTCNHNTVATARETKYPQWLFDHLSYKPESKPQFLKMWIITWVCRLPHNYIKGLIKGFVFAWENIFLMLSYCIPFSWSHRVCIENLFILGKKGNFHKLSFFKWLLYLLINGYSCQLQNFWIGYTFSKSLSNYLKCYLICFKMFGWLSILAHSWTNFDN